MQCDYLIIGSGIAGLTLALELSQHGSVIIVTKSFKQESATSYAQGGIAAALGDFDNPKKHLQDTLIAGAGLCDPKAVEILVIEGIDRVRELIKLGMQFTRDKDGELHMGKEGGHGESRIVHANDFTGRELANFLLEEIEKSSSIELLSHHMAIDLITQHHLQKSDILKASKPTCFGSYILDEKNNDILKILAKVTCLATGGAGRVYPFTTNPKIATGDGIAMAYRAGCSTRNLEFYQFHPTALHKEADPSFLISEAVRGHGALLKVRKNNKWIRFMPSYHKLKELAPRDIVARAIDSELKKLGVESVFLDITHESQRELEHHFPNIYETLRDTFRIDMAKDYIPVVPAAHYLCGGILVDHNSKTNIDNLYAVGEVASTGVHGGNRLASNSLLEGLVFGYRAAQEIVARDKNNEFTVVKNYFNKIPSWDKEGTRNPEELILIQHDIKEIQSIMWDYVGIVRSKLRLKRAIKRVDLLYEEVIEYYNRTIPTREILELRNLALVAQLIVRSAMSRNECRGLHFMTDYPENREPSREDTILKPKIG